jgi:hypothetical protein
MNRFFKFRFLGIAAFLAIIAVFSVATMFLWNALMPEIFGLPHLNYWQAAGMMIFARILFGGLGHENFGQHRELNGFHHENALRDKWKNMTEDERKEFLCSRREFSHFNDFLNEQFNASKKDEPGGKEGKSE